MTRTRVRRAILIVLVLAVVSASAAASAPRQTSPSSAACGKFLPPDQGAYFGVMPGWAFSLPTTYDDVADPQVVADFERHTGRKVVFAPWSISWHDGLPFPRADVIALWRKGYVPQIRLFNFPVQDYAPVAQPPPPGPIPSSAIAAGEHDVELRRFAAAARATNIPIMFSFDGEMTAAHPWGGRFDGGGATTGYGDPTWPDGPEHFRDAYRRIVTIFRDEGATNVTFIFSPNSVSGYAAGDYWEPWERFRWYYPGDEYMDWIGLSVYSEKIFQTGPNESFEGKLAVGDMPGYEGPYAEITALGSKPLAINEMGLNRMPSEQAKAQWVTDASAVLQSGRYPRIKAINWWAQNKGGEYDAYPNTSQTFLDGFKAAFNQPFFDAKAQFSGDCRPLRPASVRLKNGRLSWTAVPNAANYEVWRGATRVARTQNTSATVGRNALRLRVRGVNLVGAGPFAAVPRR
jgi:glycosyl hydrolase family 26